MTPPETQFHHQLHPQRNNFTTNFNPREAISLTISPQEKQFHHQFQPQKNNFTTNFIAQSNCTTHFTYRKTIPPSISSPTKQFHHQFHLLPIATGDVALAVSQTPLTPRNLSNTSASLQPHSLAYFHISIFHEANAPAARAKPLNNTVY